MGGIAEVDGDTIVVDDGRGKIQPVPCPEGVSPLSFRNAVSLVATLYLQDGKTPTVKEMHKAWPRTPEKTFAAIAITEEFSQALSYRGIPWNDESGLSVEQNLVITKMSDPTDRRSTGAKLRELNIPESRYRAWLRQPLFSEALSKMSENNLKDSIPTMLNKLVGNIESGDLNSIKLGLEMTNRYNPQQQQLEDARTVVMRVIESVIKHVQDPDTRRAILSDVESEAIGYSIANKGSLEG